MRQVNKPVVAFGKESVIKPVIAALRVLVRQGTVTETGVARGALWSLARESSLGR